MIDFTLWGILSFVSCMIYQLALFRYASTILEQSSKKILLYILLAVINTILILSGSLPFWLTYIFSAIALLIEFKIISKASFRQAFAGATIFTTHISSMHFLALAVYAAIFDILPSEILESVEVRQHSITLAFIVLTAILLVVENIISTRNIKRVTSAKLYSELLSSVAFIFIIFFSIGIYIYLSHEDFSGRLSFVVINTIFVLSIMYFLLLYVINFVNLHEYKRYADELGETYSVIQHQKSSLSSQSQRDDLTNLYNRKFINQILEELFSNPTTGFGLLFIDINRLKYVNDNFGHNNGDKLILFVADILRKVLRDCDVSARIGGDEFLVAIDNISGEAQLDKITFRINELVSIHDEIEDFPVSISIGGVFVDEELRVKGLDNAIAVADSNMRANKSCFYELEGRYVK